MLIYFVLSFLFFKDNIFIATPVLIGFVYNFWTFIQLFSEKKFIPKLGLIFLTYFIFIFLIIGSGLAVGLIINVIN